MDFPIDGDKLLAEIQSSPPAPMDVPASSPSVRINPAQFSGILANKPVTAAPPARMTSHASVPRPSPNNLPPQYSFTPSPPVIRIGGGPSFPAHPPPSISKPKPAPFTLPPLPVLSNSARPAPPPPRAPVDPALLSLLPDQMAPAPAPSAPAQPRHPQTPIRVLVPPRPALPPGPTSSSFPGIAPPSVGAAKPAVAPAPAAEVRKRGRREASPSADDLPLSLFSARRRSTIRSAMAGEVRPVSVLPSLCFADAPPSCRALGSCHWKR